MTKAIAKKISEDLEVIHLFTRKFNILDYAS